MLKIIKIPLNSSACESVIARKEIFKAIKINVEKDKTWRPIFENEKFWSISHKKELVFVWTDNKPFWIDIEIIKPRWDEVFGLHKKEEYDLTWWEKIENFYYLWTIKESVLKLN